LVVDGGHAYSGARDGSVRAWPLPARHATARAATRASRPRYHAADTTVD
jgi:hypothetical protein